MYNKKAIKHYETGRALHQKGKLHEAEIAYKKAIKINNHFVEAHNNIGNVYIDQNKLSEACAAFKHALKLSPNHPMLMNNIGNALQLQGKNESAITWLKKAIEVNNDYADAHNNLGNAYKEIGRLNHAVSSYRNAITYNPNSADTYNNLGCVLRDLNKTDDAVINFTNAIKINANHKEAYNGLGNALKDQKKLEEAIKVYKKGIKINPKNSDTYNGLGNALKDQGKLKAAAEAYKQSIKINPKHKDAHNGFGNTLKDQGKIEEAIKSYEQAIKIWPENVSAISSCFECYRILCNWNKAESRSKMLDEIFRPFINGSLFTELYRTTNPAVLLDIATEWSNHNFTTNYDEPKFDFKIDDLKSKNKLNIGYISYDFRNHPVGILIHNLFQYHNREKFEVYVYSYGPDDGSNFRKSVILGSDYFNDVTHMSDSNISEMIFHDNIDILIDLTVFTKGGRYGVCARKPAPIQINYLGFPGSSGSNLFDYIITDKDITPPGFEKFYSEKLIRLPNCYQVNSQSIRPTTIGYKRSDFMLPENATVFCSFNNPIKIDKNVFTSWMRILSSVDNSVLWLLEKNESQKKNLRKAAIKLGIDQGRIVFTNTIPIHEHLERHSLADITLDPFVYNGGMTTSISLWSNIPVVTMQGKCYISRMSSSLLHTVSLSELITFSVNEYEHIAIKLAKDKNYLANIKTRLSENINNGPLYDTPRFCKKLETSFEKIWEKYITHKPRDHIDIA